jgi:hypothetical protein
VTFEELDRRFANGFDDAKVTAIKVDYAKHSATVRLSLRMYDPDSPNRDVYSPAVLTVSGILYLSIDPPDKDHLFAKPTLGITVDGLSEDPEHFPHSRFSNRGCQAALSAADFSCTIGIHLFTSQQPNRRFPRKNEGLE